MKHRFFRLVPDNPNFPFVKYGYVFSGFSIVLTIACVAFLAARGLNYGVDFKGGTEVYSRFAQKQDVEDIRKILEPLGFEDAVVQSYGDELKNEFLVRVQSEDLGLRKFETYFTDSLGKLSGEGSAVRIRYSEDRLYAAFGSPVEVEKLENALATLPNSDLQIENISKFGKAGDNEFVIQFAGAGSRIVAALKEKVGPENVEILQVDEVGQKVGSELRQQAIGAVLISLILILVYIWFRFDFEFAPGAVMALIHDVSVILGVFALFQLPFDLSSIAAILTIVGYSINDTIVTYDRVRENMKRLKSANFPEVINISINETLGRTILISATVLMATMILYFFGGPITQGFALALTIGVISGTYSTICVASPITIYMRKYLQSRSL